MKRFLPFVFLVSLFGCGGGSGNGNGNPGGSPPVVAPLPATSVADNGAVLNGTVIPNGLPTECWFEYGLDNSLAVYDNTERQPVGSGSTGQPVSAVLTGLSNETSYFFRIVASNALGTTRGETRAFATSGCLGCHGGPDGSRPGVNGAPVVTKYWKTSGHGKNVAITCKDCHDVGSPEGQHDTSEAGTFNTLNWKDKGSDTTTANTSHLKDFFFPSPSSSDPVHSARVFDNACNDRLGCHRTASGRLVDPHRHDSTTFPPNGLMEFGQGGTTSTPKLYTWYTPVDNVLDFYRSRSPWVIRDTNSGIAEGTQYGICITCHDPHGTGTTDTVEGGDPSNVMVRGNWRSGSEGITYCSGACHVP